MNKLGIIAADILGLETVDSITEENGDVVLCLGLVRVSRISCTKVTLHELEKLKRATVAKGVAVQVDGSYDASLQIRLVYS